MCVQIGAVSLSLADLDPDQLHARQELPVVFPENRKGQKRARAAKTARLAVQVGRRA